MNIIELAFDMAAAVQDFFGKARLFYYTVMLFSHRCPNCNSVLMMITEGRCGCTSCKFEFDPTVAFQKCSKCGGVPELRLRRYYCKDCDSEVRSKFLFEGLVFEKEYFAARMAQSRQRKKEQRERVRKMLAESRSDVLPLHTVDFDSVPDLVGALNGLTAELDTDLAIEVHDGFDLNRYQDHIQTRIGNGPVNLMDIPPLTENSRKDLIWRFIAVIFLDHTGIVDIRQDGRDIMVKKHETDTEGQGVFREPEEADRIEGPVGRVEA